MSRIERYSTLLTMHSHVMLNYKTIGKSQIQISFTCYFVLTTGRHVKLHFVESLCLCVDDIWWHDIFASPQFTELCKNAFSFHSDQFSHSITHSNTWRKQKQHIPLHCFCHWNFTFIIKLDLLLVSLIIFCFVNLIQHLWAKQCFAAVGLASHVKASQNLEKVIC